jgi:hypothetical protein
VRGSRSLCLDAHLTQGPYHLLVLHLEKTLSMQALRRRSDLRLPRLWLQQTPKLRLQVHRVKVRLDRNHLCL